MTKTAHRPIGDPLWYKDAVVYEVHVRAFYDSNADGVGDLPGLRQKLDYIKDLGVTAIWILPFYPSPLKDDGYDIADYTSINPTYGTLKDFRGLLQDAHERDLRVITELVVNHTSDQHPWFQRARRAAPGSAWRNFYVWNDTPDKYQQARIIFRDFEPSNWSWDPVARAYYWHRFYSHQPDLNYDNPAVHREITRAMDFWLDMGVDGLRLDAVPYLYEREGTSCENLPETHEFLKQLRRHVDSKYGDRMLLAEANQWPEDSAAYFGQGKGDECHMAFHFPLMPRLFMSVRMEDRVPMVDILDQTPAIPETSQWGLFLRNHDELTLEMVTDEERDYMYRVYANEAKARINLGIRRRLAPLLGNNRRRIELLNILLFSYPGTPFLYYGDEIGMGDNLYLGDRNGVRTPMQWSSDKNAGFSRANPQALYFPIILEPEYHYEANNVEAQQSNPSSLWWWMKRILALRKRYVAFSRGSIRFLSPVNRKVVAFIRKYQDEVILVVANLSRFSQPATLDLAEYKGYVPVELFGQVEFDPITEQPYAMTLSPHSAFWFHVRPMHAPTLADTASINTLITVRENWNEVLGPRVASLRRALPRYVSKCRWFGAKRREIRTLTVKDVVKVEMDHSLTAILLLFMEYNEGDPETYMLPVSFAEGPERQQVSEAWPNLVIATVRRESDGTEAVLYDPSSSKQFCRALLDLVARRRSWDAEDGEFRGVPTQGLRDLDDVLSLETLEPRPTGAEQSNTSVAFGERLFLKLFRKLETGIHPDLEMSEFLEERKFPHVPRVFGSVVYQHRSGDEMSSGILTQYFPGAKDTWGFTLDSLERYFERVSTAPSESLPTPCPSTDLMGLACAKLPEATLSLLGTYPESARLLGQRTAELHAALASDSINADFKPEPFTPFYQRALFQSMRNLAVNSFHALEAALPFLPLEIRPLAERFCGLENLLLERFRTVYDSPISAQRIRCHGDYHLGQILYTGKDFVIIDFEGEPARSISARRIKRPSLRDVAGLLRSFDYATHSALAIQAERGATSASQQAHLEAWAHFWYQSISSIVLQSYLAHPGAAALLPSSKEHLKILLEVHLLEKVVYEIDYELNNRPAWLRIPLQGALSLLEPYRASSIRP